MVKTVCRGDSELEVFAATVYAEARGEGELGMRAVAHVMHNRARANRAHWGGSSVKSVCLKEWQFECWNKVDSMAIHEEGKFYEARNIASQVMSGNSVDPTGGCDHYYAPAKESPSWRLKIPFVKTIGNHNFHKEL